MSGHRDDGSYAEDKAHHLNRKVGRDWSGIADSQIGTNFIFGQKDAPQFKGTCDSCGNNNPNLFEWNRNDGYSNHYSCKGPDCPGGGDMTVAQDIHKR